MFCPKCGSQVPDGTKFCPACGNPMAAVPQGGPVQPEPAPASASGGYVGQSPVPPVFNPYQRGPIKADRSLAAYILLSLVTCGIYGLYFFYRLAKDVNTMCEGDGETTPGLAAFILLTYVTCGFYAFYWYYKIGNRLSANASRYGLAFQENGTTVLMWCIVGYITCGIGNYVAMYFIIKNANAMATAYNSRVFGR